MKLQWHIVAYRTTLATVESRPEEKEMRIVCFRRKMGMVFLCAICQIYFVGLDWKDKCRKYIASEYKSN